MTSILAGVVQRYFTALMPTRTITRSRETIYEKAERILSDPARVVTSENSDAPHWWTGRVVGDHGTYSAFAVSEEMKGRLGLEGVGRMGCLRCQASARGKLCSHAIVAEGMRLRGEKA